MAKRKMKLELWLGRNNARVMEDYTTKGKPGCTAALYVPEGAYAMQWKQKKVSSTEEGWAWIEEVALAWAENNNVEFYGSAQGHSNG